MTKTKELTVERYRELVSLKEKLEEEASGLKYNDPNRELKNSEIDVLNKELVLYRTSAEDFAKMVSEFPSFKANMLHGINRITNQRFTDVSIKVDGVKIIVTTEEQKYLGDLNNFIKTIRAEATGYLSLDPLKQERSMSFRVHIYYQHPSGGRNGCESEPELTADFRDVGGYKCKLYKQEEIEIPVRVGS